MIRRILAIILCLLPSLARAEDVSVSAAISLKDALTAAADQYQKQSGQSVRLNFGASGDLANQIIAGAPVDLFISAGPSQITQLSRAKMIDGNATVLARNELVLIAPAKIAGVGSWKDLPNENHVCIGDPKSVPAGQYAMQVFDHLGIAKPLAGKLIYAANVRQVLGYVERGEVDAGVVYATDARQAGAKVRVIAEAPPESHDPIQYPAVLIRGGNTIAAEKFLGFFITPPGEEILLRFGFKKGTP